MSVYIEYPSDANFSAFLAGLTPGLVLRDRERSFSKQERKRQIFLRDKARLERRQSEVETAKTMAQLMVLGRLSHTNPKKGN